VVKIINTKLEFFKSYPTIWQPECLVKPVGALQVSLTSQLVPPACLQPITLTLTSLEVQSEHSRHQSGCHNAHDTYCDTTPLAQALDERVVLKCSFLSMRPSNHRTGTLWSLMFGRIFDSVRLRRNYCTTGVLVHTLLFLFSNRAPRERIETLFTFNGLVWIHECSADMVN